MINFDDDKFNMSDEEKEHVKELHDTVQSVISTMYGEEALEIFDDISVNIIEMTKLFGEIVEPLLEYVDDGIDGVDEKPVEFALTTLGTIEAYVESEITNRLGILKKAFECASQIIKMNKSDISNDQKDTANSSEFTWQL